MAVIQTQEAARRLARTIASDLSLYNEEKILRGLQNDSLFEEMADEIAEGRSLFQSRVAPELQTHKFYERALVDVLIKAKAHVKSPLW